MKGNLECSTEDLGGWSGRDEDETRIIAGYVYSSQYVVYCRELIFPFTMEQIVEHVC